MDDLPKPPSWPRESVVIDDEVADAMSSVRTTAFFDERGDAEQEAAETFDIVGRGTGRVVVAGGGLPDGVIAKISLNHRGYQANTAEKFEREQHPDLAPYLPPVLATDTSSHWAVYERCEVPGDNEARKQLETVLDEAEVSYIAGELASPNIGYYNGRPCIVDWAELLR